MTQRQLVATESDSAPAVPRQYGVLFSHSTTNDPIQRFPSRDVAQEYGASVCRAQPGIRSAVVSRVDATEEWVDILGRTAGDLIRAYGLWASGLLAARPF